MIQKELDTIRKDVSETLKQIEVAVTKEERRKLAAELNSRISK